MNKDEILQAQTAHDMLVHMKANKDLLDSEVWERYNALLYQEYVIECPDADMHYDFFKKPLLQAGCIHLSDEYKHHIN